MNAKLKFAGGIYALNIVVMLAIGLLFEFRTEFMPFHADVIQTSWQSVDAMSQILYLGMMKTEGAGFLASATAFAFLLYFPFRNFEKWAYYAITSIGIVEYLPSLLANYHVSTVSSASPPWLLMLSLSLSLIIALALALLGHVERERALGLLRKRMPAHQ